MEVTHRDIEAELARRIAAGEHASVEEARFCEIFAPRIRRFGLRHLRDADRANDLMQQALLVTLERLRAGAVRQHDQIASFVLGVSRMIARDMTRAEWKREQAAQAWARQQDAAVAPCEPMDLDRLDGCLGGLVERERAVVLLSFYAEATAADIARELSLSPGNVRVIRHRALTRLRGCLEGAGSQP